MENQTDYSRLELGSVIKSLIVDKCKTCEIYRRMCEMYREACFSQNIVHKWAKNGFATTSQSRKDHSLKWKHTDSLVRKKFRAQQSVKVTLRFFTDTKRLVTIDYFEKGETVNGFLLPTPKTKSPLIY